MRYILEPLEGENWEWDKEHMDMTFTNKEQGLIDIYMKQITLFLAESANYHVELLKVDKDIHKNTLVFLEELLKNFIILLKNVGFYPEKYMNEICVESKAIFSRNLTAIEIYRLICVLEKLCERYDALMFGSAEKKKKLENTEIKIKSFKEERCKTPEMFKYY